jgi:hypothetical protein
MKRYLGTFDLLKIRRDKEAHLTDADETLKELEPIDDVEAAILVSSANQTDLVEHKKVGS